MGFWGLGFRGSQKRILQSITTNAESRGKEHEHFDVFFPNSFSFGVFCPNKFRSESERPQKMVPERGSGEVLERGSGEVPEQGSGQVPE